jgi:hypothetical protein
VFDRKDWEQLLGRSVVPKLAFALQELAINPVHQELEPLHWVLAWQDVMPLSQASRQAAAAAAASGSKPQQLAAVWMCRRWRLAACQPAASARVAPAVWLQGGFPRQPAPPHRSGPPLPCASHVVPLCTVPQMASLFEQYFFPKWHAVLRHWLSNSPNYDEVTRW